MQPNSSPASFSKRVKGWIFDVYPSNPGEVAVWVIGENGERVRFTDKFQSKIYVSGKQEDIERLSSQFFSSRIMGLRVQVCASNGCRKIQGFGSDSYRLQENLLVYPQHIEGRRLSEV